MGLGRDEGLERCCRDWTSLAGIFTWLIPNAMVLSALAIPDPPISLSSSTLKRAFPGAQRHHFAIYDLSRPEAATPPASRPSPPGAPLRFAALTRAPLPSEQGRPEQKTGRDGRHKSRKGMAASMSTAGPAGHTQRPTSARRRLRTEPDRTKPVAADTTRKRLVISACYHKRGARFLHRKPPVNPRQLANTNGRRTPREALLASQRSKRCCFGRRGRTCLRGRYNVSQGH